MDLALRWPDMMEDANHEASAWALLRERIADELRLQGRAPATVETAVFARVNRAALESVRDQLADMESALGLYAAISRLPRIPPWPGGSKPSQQHAERGGAG
ncbi:hypothetical protein AB0C13_39765 [Streptomyces sp. NPDC049099]|uniref:hypothetical protein n=1 Tax=Streptomyces sp. NPDC049099 TaxID=3155768 RepID=UPI00342C0670